MKVFARECSEGPNVYNIQLETWKLAVDRWRHLDHRSRYEEVESEGFFEEACVILVLAGTSMSQILGQQTADEDPERVPRVKDLITELITGYELRQALLEFDDIYEDLRHFGRPKHMHVLGIGSSQFTRWMLAVQSLWLLLGNPDESKAELFSHSFDVDWVSK